jgi:CheY-like chemotaxis protein
MLVRCLIVDDSDEFLRSATRLLESQGMEIVACAATSAQALERAAALRPDVALVDVDLGSESGIDLARRLTASLPELQIILISAHDEGELADLLADNPGYCALTKGALGMPAIAGLLV